MFQVEDAVITRRAGELAFAPRGVAHTLANHSDAPARYLLVCTPGRVRALLRAHEREPAGVGAAGDPVRGRAGRAADRAVMIGG